MQTKRQRKFARLLQKDLGEIFQQASNTHFEGAFITVTQAIPSPDLRQAKIYLSFMLVSDKKRLMELIGEKAKMIRQTLGQRLRHQVKVIPELYFYHDNTEEVIEEVNDLFKNLDIPPSDEPNEDTP